MFRKSTDAFARVSIHMFGEGITVPTDDCAYCMMHLRPASYFGMRL
jgi:predicted signal transduction protein with EAL and GGDEF domain